MNRDFMSTSLLRNQFLTFAIGISFLGLVLAVMLAFNPPIVQEGFPWRKPVVGALFGAICLLGITAVFFPKQCSTIFGLTKGKQETNSDPHGFASHENSPTLRGHHPDCKRFSAHVIRIKSKTFCAACTGLLLGAVLALAGTADYFFGSWHGLLDGFLAVFIGVLGVGLGLFQLKFKGFVRLLLNTFFVLGAFSILIGIDKLAQSILTDFFLVSLTLFWLFTRISLSEWDHWRICYTCKSPCEIREIK